MSNARFFFTYINDDSELDMYIFEYGNQVKWSNNIRGASEIFNPYKVTKTMATQMKVCYMDSDYILDVVILDGSK